MRKIGLLSIIIFLITTSAFSQDIPGKKTFAFDNQEKDIENEQESLRSSFRHSINMCPGGIAFGIYSFNYEYLFAKSQGIVARYDYEMINTRFSDVALEATGMAFILNYRWHFAGELNSGFLGAYSRYRNYKGSGLGESGEFEFTLPEFTIGLNIGKRWVWNNGININIAIGYGYSFEKTNADLSDPLINSTMETFNKEYKFIGPFLAEFSVGYAF